MHRMDWIIPENVIFHNLPVSKMLKEVARLVEERFPKLNGKVKINYIGTTIGSHTGPGTVALFFWGKKRED